jgi:carbon-monoxide dehydrogenase medium subunit
MSPFELAQPRSLPEALALLDQDGARPLSGGTALMLMMKAGVLRPTRLVSLRRLGLETIEADGELRIGAMATLRSLERLPAVRQHWPAIARTLRTLSNVRVRNVATVGGALAHADPHMDLPPLFSALGARATIVGPKGERTLPLEALYAGYLETTLERNELITAVRIPPMGEGRAAYLKCTTRSADDWPAVGIAVVIAGADVRVVLGAAADKPTRLVAAEKALKGVDLSNPKILREAAEAAAEEVALESDQHGSAAYKKQLIRVYLQRTIDEARRAIH